MKEDTETRCICGGKLETLPDPFYGTVWRCVLCGQEYAEEE